MKYGVVLCTVSDSIEAEKIATAVVSERLAACVNRVKGVVSHYIWEGELKKDEEELLVIKTEYSRFEALKSKIESLHSYDTPEIVFLPIEDGNSNYLEWISSSLNK